jgi:hypothetical protein
MPDERLGLDRYKRAAGNGEGCREHLSRDGGQGRLLDATRTILRRAEDEIDIPAAGWKVGR